MSEVKILKKVKKSDSVDIVVQEVGEKEIDLRYFVTTDKFKGYRKNGIRMSMEKAEEINNCLTEYFKNKTGGNR